MIFTSVERDQPHVAIIDRTVLAIEKLFKSAVIRTMSRDRIHVPWFGLDLRFAPLPSLCVILVLLNCDWNGEASIIEDF